MRDHLGMDVGGDAPGEAWATVTVGPEHLNPNGVVHGAVLFAMVDTAMGRAAMSVLEAGRFCASAEVQLRFIRPASGGTLRAAVSVVKRGKAIVHLEGRVHDDADRLVATAAGTFAVIELPSGTG
nr:PaaI family thioesterase [Rhabdothermincola salaria]